MAEYFIEVQGENKKHLFRVRAQFTRGRDLVAFPTNEVEYLAAPEPDEVDILHIYLAHGKKEREIQWPRQWLEDAITEKIIQGERYGFSKL